MSEEKNNHNAWRVVAIVFTAVALLAGISLLPFEKWTKGKINDFNLIGDIVDSSDSVSDSIDVDDGIGLAGAEDIDPELQIAMSESSHQKDSANGSENEESAEEEDIPAVAKEVQPSKQGSQMVLEDYTASGLSLIHI